MHYVPVSKNTTVIVTDNKFLSIPPALTVGKEMNEQQLD